MIRCWTSALQLAELFVSSLMHMGYGFYIFSTAVAGDASQALSDMLFKPNLDPAPKKEGSNETPNADGLPPIVLVHGIFGFGKGVCFTSSIHFSFSFIFLKFSWVCLIALIFGQFSSVSSIVSRDWEGYLILVGQRRKMRGFLCLI